VNCLSSAHSDELAYELKTDSEKKQLIQLSYLHHI